MTAIIRRNPDRRLTLFEPYYRPLNLLEEFETIAREAFDGGRSYFRAGLLHSLDVYREKDDLVVKAELPGIHKKDLDISLEDDVLTIKAEKKKEEVTEEATYYSSERHFGQYSRTIALPFSVDAEKISATFKNGLLEMRLPKAEETGTKRIEVNVK
ncbi:Hsp20/alpha crystallin family protein [Chloroflexota bacterium]